MKTVIAKLKSISPYSNSRHYTDPAKKKGESHRDYEARTWRERCHAIKENGQIAGPEEDGNIFIPPMAFKNCVSEIAKFLSVQIPGKGKSTYTKHFEAGVLVMEPMVLPIRKMEVPGEWLFVPADGKRGGSKRVDKCFPLIREWSGQVTFYILDETLMQKINPGEMTAFEYHLREAGNFIGIGRFRPRNNGFYGRFSVEKLEIS